MNDLDKFVQLQKAAFRSAIIGPLELVELVDAVPSLIAEIRSLRELLRGIRSYVLVTDLRKKIDEAIGVKP